MKYINAIIGGFMALIIFTITTFMLPQLEPPEKVELILTVSSFLFAIFTGFFISRASSRYDKILEILSDEDAEWVTVYRNSKNIEESFLEQVREIMDKYYTTAEDYFEESYYKPTIKYLDQIYNLTKKQYEKFLGKSKTGNPIMLSQIMNSLSRIEKLRNRNSVMKQERITKGQWTILLFLGTIIIFSLFFMRTPEIFSQITTIILSTTVVLVIFLLRDLENMKLIGKYVTVESSQEILDMLGKLRYYNQKFVKEGSIKIPKNLKKYRLGLHKPGEEQKIKIVTKE